MDSPFFIQAVGFCALTLIVLSFQKNRKSFTLFLLLIAAFLFSIHYALLGAWTAALVNIISAIRAFVFSLRGNDTWVDNNMTLYAFVVLFLLAGVFTIENIWSVLPVISMIIECFALWTKKTKYMRWLFFSARPPWIIYNVLVGSYAGLITEIFIVLSLTIAIIRFDILKQKE